MVEVHKYESVVQCGGSKVRIILAAISQCGLLNRDTSPESAKHVAGKATIGLHDAPKEQENPK
jgi:hypothetical protein